MTTVENLLKFEIPEIVFGRGALGQIGDCAARLGGERVLLVTDPGVVAAGWIDEAIGHLVRAGLDWEIFDNISSNPRDFQVEQGIQLYRRKRCDVIVAVGGGSPIDAAKGVAILASNHGAIHDYEGCNLVTQPIPPLVCAPTTAGTGSDVSQFAIIADARRKMKMTILSRAIMPDVSLIDPRVLTTLSPELIAATGMDALTHAIEAYVSSLAWPMTDPHALHAIELTGRHLRDAVHYKTLAALDGMFIACLEAGIAFSNAILGAIHALAHPLGGVYDIHHGLANAALLPTVVRKNMGYALGRFADIAHILSPETREQDLELAAFAVPDMLETLIADIDLPGRLSQLGVDPADIPMLAEMAQVDPCMLTNPYCYSKSEIEAMYQDAL